MNTKDYIASGVLESYVLGLASDTEIAEVEQIASEYPEIRAEIRAIESALESYAFADAQAPPADLENKIWEKIQNLDSEDKESKPLKNNVIDFDSGMQIADNQVFERKGFFSKYLNVAASVAFLVSLLGNVYLLNKDDKVKEKLSLAIQKNIELQDELKSQKNLMPDEVDLIMDPSKKLCKLMGSEISPTSTVMLAWDMKTNKIYLLRPNLPMPPKGKQYQLWAIMGDTPVDVGVFDMKMRMQELKSTTMPKAFAVTLENMGGSPKPTSGVMALGL